MSFIYETTLDNEKCLHLLSKGNYLNFLGYFEENKTYRMMDSFTKDGKALVCVGRNKVMEVNTFIRELQRLDMFDRFYELGQKRLAEATKKVVNIPEEPVEVEQPLMYPRKNTIEEVVEEEKVKQLQEKVEEAVKEAEARIEALDAQTEEVEPVKIEEPIAEVKPHNNFNLIFICDVNLILHSSLEEIAKFCEVNDMCIEINDIADMQIVPQHDAA